MTRKYVIAISLLTILTTIQAQTLDQILKHVDQRFLAYEEMDTLTMDVTSTVKHMNSKWEHTKITRVEKSVSVYGDSTHEDYHKVTEEKKGKIKDLTEKAREDVRKAQEKQSKNKKEDGNNNQSIELDELWMLEKERENYNYTLLPDTLLNNRWTHPISVEAHFDSDTLYEGIYYIEKDTYDLMMVDMKPSKNPKMVKEMRLQFWFAPVKHNQLLLERTWTKIYASLLIKKFRIIIDESYTNYQFPNR